MMKRIVFLVLIFVGIAYAKESCYSVQLLSKVGQKPVDFSLENYPHDCQDMMIGEVFTLRCGCFSEKENAKKRLEELRTLYPQAILKSTYKYRFSKRQPQAQENQRTTNNLTSILQIPKQPLEQKQQPKQQSYSKKACYSVEIIHATKTQKNLDNLLTHEYPKECKVMAFSYSLGVRCGCKNSKEAIKPLLGQLKKNYPKARIASTYTYRFDPSYKVESISEPKHQFGNEYSNEPITHYDDDLRLLLQVFLYKGDIENGYKVATLGAKKYPNSIYWNKKAIQLCQWSDKTDESIQYLKQLYKLTNDPKLEKDIITYGVDNYEYEKIKPVVLDKLKKKFTKENFDLVVFVYKRLGEPEKIIALALKEYKKDPSKRFLLALGLRTSLETGDLENAKLFSNLIEEYPLYTKEEATLLARYYYITRDFKKSFAVLLKADTKKKEDPKVEIKYHILVSDLGWLMQKKDIAAQSALYLINHDKARIDDYERVFNNYLDKDPSIALNSIKKGYKIYHFPYLFFNYAQESLNLERYDDLNSFIKEINGDTVFSDNSFYWLIKASLYTHYQENLKAQKALQKALALSPDNINIRITLMWNFINSNDIYHLKLILKEIEEANETLDPNLYFPLASAYFYLHNITKANYYLDKIELEKVETDPIEFLFLQGYVYQIQNRPGAFLSNMLKIEHILTEQTKKDPDLWKNPQFLSNYLRSIIHTKQNDFFVKKLQEFKPYLLPKDYEEISYSYANKIGSKELAHQIYYNAVYKPLWMQFSDALLEVDHSRIEDLLYHYTYALSAGDAIKAAKEDGQIALAQSMNFLGLDYNNYNQNMYIQHRDISKKRSDILMIKPSYYSRDPLLQKYIKITNRTYLRDNYYLHVGLAHYLNDTMDDTVLTNLEDTTSMFVELEKRFDKAIIKVLVGYNDKFDTYLNYRLYGSYQLTDALNIALEYAKAKESEESTQLYLAGNKDTLEATLSYKLVESILVELALATNEYYSNDDIYLGKSTTGRLAVTKTIRVGYPDMLVGGFYDFGTYSEDFAPNGVIDDIQVQNYNILPNNFFNIGVTFGYGLANSDLYTRVWRPFFQGAAYYNSDLDDLSYSFMCGYGGKVWHQDHLVFGANYIDSVNGIGGRIFELYLNYKFLYHLPR